MWKRNTLVAIDTKDGHAAKKILLLKKVCAAVKQV